MKILIANIGSTSLKWRLFEFSNSAERLLHKGGFERVADFSRAIEDSLSQLKDAGVLANESELAAVGFKTVIAKGITGCVRLDERVLSAMEAYSGSRPRTTRPTSPASACLGNACRACRWSDCSKPRFINSRPKR